MWYLSLDEMVVEDFRIMQKRLIYKRSNIIDGFL